MKLGLRTRLIGTIVGAILVFFIVSALAARSTMSNDLSSLGRKNVQSGSLGFNGYWEQKRDQIRLLTQQVAIQEAIRKDVGLKATKALETALTGVARNAGLSFLTIVDRNGIVIARANGGGAGLALKSSYVKRALEGESVNTAARLSLEELTPEALAPQVSADIKDQRDAVVGKMTEGLALVSAAPISDANERTIGAVYGGTLINHYYDIVDQASRALGGKSALIVDRAIVASTISRADGTRLVDSATTTGMADVKAGKSYTGIDTQAGVQYLAQIDPILNDQNEVVAARWFGVPLAQFNDIQNHTTQSLLLWGVIGLVIALAFAIPVVEAVSRAIIKRSKQVSESAKELALIVVGSEVSGDHVAQTRAAVERQGELLMQMATSTPTSSEGAIATNVGVKNNVLAASALNAEILGDVVVIDMLAQEMNGRMQHAVTRVNELNDVARGLDELVSGGSSA